MGTGPHHHNTNAQGLWMQPRKTKVLVSLSGLWRPVPTPVFLPWPLDWTQQHARYKIIIGKTEGTGPKSGSGKFGYGMLKLACQAGILKAGPWNYVIYNFRNKFSRRQEHR